MRSDILASVRPGGILARGPRITPVFVTHDPENEETIVQIDQAIKAFSSPKLALDFAAVQAKRENRTIEYLVIEAREIELDEFIDRFAPELQDKQHCHSCSGSGEGQSPDSVCFSCRGSGVVDPLDWD